MSNEFEQNQNNEEIPSMEEILAESVEVKIGDTVTGEVLSIDDNQVIVGIEGAGVEGVIPFKELSAQPIDSIEEVAKVGDTLELVVIKQIKEKENGSFLLSRRRIEAKKVWAELEVKAENGEIITVPVKSVVKGGLVVDAGVRGFIPASMVEDFFVDDFSPYKGQEVEVLVLSVDEERGRISLSIKALQPGPWENIEEKAPKGAELEGTVRRLVDFGAFVEVFPGVEGLVHISQISHDHVATPGEKLTEGQAIQVKVLDVDDENERLSLSIKALEEAPEADASAQSAAPREEKRQNKPRKQNNNRRNNAANASSDDESGFTFGDLLGDQLKNFDFGDDNE